MILLSIDIWSLLILFIMGLLILTIFSIPYVTLYFLFRWLKKRRLSYIGVILFATFTIWLVYTAYTAINPTDKFYYSEFKEITLREIPKSADILYKAASYPDFHGDYCSAALISLSVDDYNVLLYELSDDSRILKNAELIGSSILNEVMSDYEDKQIIYSFSRQISGEDDHHLFIGFLDDKRTIIINVCVT